MTTVTLNAIADAFIYNQAATTNYGSADNLDVGERNDQTTYKYRSLVKFDLSGIPSNATILSATLWLTVSLDYSGNAANFRVYRTLRAWSETYVTWNVYYAGMTWQTAGGFGASDCEQTDIGYLQLSASETIGGGKAWTLDPAKIQEMVNGTFPNRGFFLKTDNELNDMYAFHSRNSATAGPKLVIEYTMGGGRQFKSIWWN